MGVCQNYGPFLGPYYNTGPNTGPNLGDPKRDHNFDKPPDDLLGLWGGTFPEDEPDFSSWRFKNGFRV